MKQIVLLTLLLLFHFADFSFATDRIATEIPDVNIAIIRLDYSSYSFKGFYEFSEKFRKSLPEENYIQLHNIYYYVKHPADDGFIDIKSILTGKPLVYISTYWCGGGWYEFPADSLFSSEYTKGFLNPAPDTLIKLFTTEANNDRADSAWIKIRYSDIISRISSLGKYEIVVVFEPYSREWLIIAYTRPYAPIEIVFVDKTWPRTLVSRNVKTIPEIVVHNFSDTSLSFKSQLNIYQSDKLFYESVQDITELPPDSSFIVYFNPIMVNESIPLTYNFNLLSSKGDPWQDAYPDNDTIMKLIHITNQPVFRPVSSIKHPGNIPTQGMACDFDGDNDIDIIQYKPTVKLWQNVNGGYFDITTRSILNLNPDSRLAIVKDFNNDTYPDILMIFFEYNPIILFGDGSGIFVDRTTEAGLSNVTGFFDAEAFDLENDGDLDLIFQSYGQEGIFLNDGSGKFSDITSRSGINDPGTTQDVTAGDLNNDGFQDLVLTNWELYSKIFINNTNGSFYPIEFPWELNYPRMCTIFDYNKDGLNDILFCRVLYNGSTVVYMNKGNLSFEKAIDLPSSFHAAAQDINGDGMTDLILDRLDSFILLLNKNGNFQDYTHLLVDMRKEFSLGALGNSPKAQFIDLDRDGDLDIYSQMVIFNNQGFDSTITFINYYSDSQIPTSFRVLQNFPNPFNSSTTIRYYLSQNESVELEIYNLTGQLVKKLFNGSQCPGLHQIFWDGSGQTENDVSSGCYIYRLKTESFSDSKKMLLLR